MTPTLWDLIGQDLGPVVRTVSSESTVQFHTGLCLCTKVSRRSSSVVVQWTSLPGSDTKKTFTGVPSTSCPTSRQPLPHTRYRTGGPPLAPDKKTVPYPRGLDLAGWVSLRKRGPTKEIRRPSVVLLPETPLSPYLTSLTSYRRRTNR